MSTCVYPWCDIGGRPVAIREGRSIYPGSGDGAPVATVEDQGGEDGGRIWPGPAATGAGVYWLVGDHVMAGGPGGNVVFTIKGNTIHDGMGESPFLQTSGEDDPLALAGAAVGYIGEARLRSHGSHMVDRSAYETEVSDHYRSWDEPIHDYHATGGPSSDQFADRIVPDDLAHEWQTHEMGLDGHDNISKQQVPLTRKGNCPLSSGDVGGDVGGGMQIPDDPFLNEDEYVFDPDVFLDEFGESSGVLPPPDGPPEVLVLSSRSATGFFVPFAIIGCIMFIFCGHFILGPLWLVFWLCVAVGDRRDAKVQQGYLQNWYEVNKES